MNTLYEGYYIGLMTGTSMDGVDTVLVDIHDNNKTQLISSYEQPLTDDLRDKIIGASNASADSLHDIALLDQELAETYATCIQSLLKQSGIKADNVQAIGSHGQTIRHCPDCQPPYTIQIGNADRLVELTGITVVSNFRQRDMAAGGQGAPLAPLFHHHLFAQPGTTRVCINLGGIANISVLNANGLISGFDTGPANTLMDHWAMRQRGERYDKDAYWASSGRVNESLLNSLLSEPWLSRQPPKSTGPELFNLQWLDSHLAGLDVSPVDVQRTLCEYTAMTLSDAISRYAPDSEELIVCGGGAYNPLLLERIEHHLPDKQLQSSEAFDMAPEWVEASMFAWLAWRTLNGLPGNVPTVTGASHEVVLGAIHPA
ncbi:MAG: anhydro-N-acetylmuramic acid kinase [Gammaproteobacteria bacterium]|nr:anhydro-N-acetylmuramic acid kinase [Gammaproteobacteria bacterium]